MEFYELQPTDENIRETYLKNTLDRNSDMVGFIMLLNSRERCCSIALDGNWGSGKTFFIKQTKMVIDSLTSNEGIDEDIKNMWKITNPQNDTTQIKSQITVYYDSWINDNDDDPILSLMSEISINLLNTDVLKCRKDLKNIVKNTLKTILDILTNDKFSKITSNMRSKDILLDLKRSKKIKSTIDEFLNSLMGSDKRLIIFIDELDRCKPAYAVKLLERIKHYFCNDRLTFVFSINTHELQNTIKHHYGENTNASKYLDRFFDFQISLPKADLDKYYEAIHFEDVNTLHGVTADAVIKYYHFELREITRYLQALEMIQPYSYYGTRHAHHNDIITRVSFIYIIPIMVGLRMHDPIKYENFIDGKDWSPLLEIIKDYNVSRMLDSIFTNSEDTFKDKSISINDRVTRIYEFIFDNDIYLRSENIHDVTPYLVKDLKNILLQCMNLNVQS